MQLCHRIGYGAHNKRQEIPLSYSYLCPILAKQICAEANSANSKIILR